jgi:hypothetical protein
MNESTEFFTRHGLPAPVLEHRFHPTRLWRFDYAWPAHRVALEVEGGRFTGGRHTSAEGFHKDLEKYNAAACLGWRVLRITPRAVGTLVPVSLVREALSVKDSETADLLDTVEDLARQHCHTGTALRDYNGQVAGTLVTDSGALTTDAIALRRLAEAGRFRIVAEHGRMVVGYWPENEPRKEAQP